LGFLFPIKELRKGAQRWLAIPVQRLRPLGHLSHQGLTRIWHRCCAIFVP